MNKRMISLTGCLTAVLIMNAASARGDHFFKQTTNTEPIEFMGETMPAQSDTSITWFGADRVYSESGRGVTIARFDQGYLYTLDRNSKTFTKISLETLADMSSLLKEMSGGDEEMAKVIEQLQETGSAEELDQALADSNLDPETAESLKGMMQMLFGKNDPSQPMVTAVVNPTDETKNIGPWKCRKYIATMNMPMIEAMTSEIWATEDIDIDYESIMKASMGMAAQFPGFIEAMEEFKKIKGMAVTSTVAMQMMGMQMNITTELIEYQETQSPAKIYELPEGYTEVEFGAFQAGN